MTEPHPDREIEPEYPTGIVARPFTLDDLTFTPHGTHGNMERAECDGEYIGDVLLDGTVMWFARCHEARLDLSEDDEEWIAALHAATPHAIKRGQAGRLLRCARQLQLIEIAEPA